MLNNQQKEAFENLKEGKSCIITGNAGTGKSFLIDKYIAYCHKVEKSIMVCAPTGIAAINIDGVTLHRAFGLRTGPILEPAKNIPSALKDTDTLIIDEISMVRIDVFDYIAKAIISLNNQRLKEHKKELQLILVGDFFQLPPVITKSDRGILELKYKSLGMGFAFQSEYWKLLKLHKINLTEQMRQDNKEFIDSLNKIRFGDIKGIKYFNENNNTSEIKDAVFLCGTNKMADKKNEYEFNKLTTKIEEFITKETGTVNKSDKVVPDVLKLREGCRVMMLINDPNQLYVNGTFAEVLKINNNKVKILTDNSVEVDVEKHTWEVKTYEPKKESGGKTTANEKVIGTYTQFPMKLAYAITIHKSQGQTYDEMNLNPFAWDCGQLYVALSRVRSIEGLHLTYPIVPEYLVTSTDVKQFYSLFD